MRTACLTLIVWSVLDELLQIPIPGRVAEVHDGLADAAGSISGALLAAMISLSRRLKSARDNSFEAPIDQ